MLSIRLAVYFHCKHREPVFNLFNCRFTLFKLDTRISCTYLETYSYTLDSFYPVSNDQDHYPNSAKSSRYTELSICCTGTVKIVRFLVRDFVYLVYLVFCEGSGALSRPSFHAEDMKLLCMHGYSSRAILPERLRQILSLIVHEIFHAHTSVYL